MAKEKPTPHAELTPFDEKAKHWNAIIDTPKGSRNKYKYDEPNGVFKLAGVLPAGASFPFDFGYFPGTKAEDGDPIDVLVLMDEPAFAGCLVPCRLIGVIEAEQTERDGKTTRNDRLIGVAMMDQTYEEVQSLDALPKALLKEIEHFFVSYNTARGKKFKVLGRKDGKGAEKLARAATVQ